MSVFTSHLRQKPWLWQITLLSSVLGALLALSLKTQDRIRGEQIPNMRINQFAAEYASMRDAMTRQKKELSDLRVNLTKYQKAAEDESGTAKLLSRDLQKANLLAGIVAVTGPGVVVTLRDSKNPPPKPADMSPESYIEIVSYYQIHDKDIQLVINELRASGAEAIAVNDQRVVSTTAVRCVGPVVMVNNTQTNGSPVKISAIGDPDTLLSALTMTGGVSHQFLNDPAMFGIDKVKSLTLPAYSGATPIRFAQPAPDAKAEQAQRQSEKSAQTSKSLPVGTPGGDTAPDSVGPGHQMQTTH